MTTTTEATGSRQDIGIQRIGDYLLKGWVLTDQGCTRCNIPTMRTKDRQQVGFCVLCDDKLNPIPLNLDENVPLNNTLDESVYEEDLDELLASVDQNIPKVDVSALLGQKLLQGWTMMEDICPRDMCVGVNLLIHADLS
jgi:uncharacterized Zn finger protein (UPF0148 family)